MTGYEQALAQLARSGYAAYLTGSREVCGDGWIGWMRAEARPRLVADERFTAWTVEFFHSEIGRGRYDCRADRGVFGPRSLQIVIGAPMIGNGETVCRCYFDVDRANPHGDVINKIGHLGEVLCGWGSGLVGWLKGRGRK